MGRHWLGACALAGMLACGAANADEAPAFQEKVEVTGSNIPRIDRETGLPVQTITRAEIDRMGVTTAEQLLTRVSAIGPGGHNTAEGLGDGARSGLSAVSLRGLGSSNTLVLLNGRRLSNFAFNDVTGGSAVNVNQIPMAAVERVEVLKDGASAIYGTDAIGGVINFILRKDYQGAEVAAYASGTQDGGGAVHRYTATAGYGSISKDGFNVLAVAEYEKDKALASVARSFSSTSIRPDLDVTHASLSTFPANFRFGRSPTLYNTSAASGCVPAAGSFQANQATGAADPLQTYCIYDFTSVIDITPPSERKGFFGRGVWQINADHQAFVEYHLGTTDILFAVSETPISWRPDVPGFVYPVGGPYYPSSVTLPDGSVIQPRGPLRLAWRLRAEGRRTDRVETREDGWTAGLQGRLQGWDYDAAVSEATSNARDFYLSGFVTVSGIGSALSTGLVDVFTSGALTPEAQALLDKAVIHQKVKESDAKVSAFSAKASREVFEGPNGPIALAVGLDHRREELEERPESVLFSGDIAGAGTPLLPTTRSSRRVSSLFAEFDIPVLKDLETQAALRYDYFSDFGGTLNPKVALRWTPDKRLLLRASFGTGFRAPTMTDVYLPPSVQFDDSHWDPVRCATTPDGGVPVADYVSPDECNGTTQHIGGNRKAQPEKSHQWSAGFVVEPVTGVSVGADYWTIRRRESLQLVDPTAIFDTLARADPVSAGGRFIRLPRLADGRCQGDGDVPTPANVPCAIDYYNDLIENVGKYNVTGIDVSATGRWPSKWGLFSARLDGTYFVQYRYQLVKDGPYADNVGKFGDNGVVSRWKHYLSVDWKSGAWTATVAQNFVLGYLDQAENAEGPLPPRRVGSYETYDLQCGWEGLRNLKATIGVKNVFNRDPPASRQGQTFQVGYDARYYDPAGRTYYASLKYAFK